MLNKLNWEYDLYLRIDEIEVFTATIKNEFVVEIKWCYRFGYINETHRDLLLQYLDHRISVTDILAAESHLQRMEQIRRNQELLKLQSEERKAIKELFKSIR